MGNFRELANLSANALNAFLVPTTDVSSFKWLSLHLLSSAFTGTITFQGSNDGVTFKPVQLFEGDTLSVNGSSVANASNLIFHGPVYYRYFNVQVTSYSSGTQTAVLELYETPAWSWPSQVALGTGFNVIGTTGIAYLNVGGGSLESVHDNQDNQTAVASGVIAVGTTEYGPFQNQNGKGIFVFLNITASTTGSIQLQIVGVDPVTDGEVILLSDAFAITGTGFFTFILYPGVTTIASTSATVPGTGAIRTAVAAILPRTWEINAIVSTATVTASISYAYENN